MVPSSGGPSHPTERKHVLLQRKSKQKKKMSLFIKKRKQQKTAEQGLKRKGSAGKSVSVMKKPVPKKRKFKDADEEIPSDSDEGAHDDIIGTKDAEYSSSESEEETAAEKKLRLAKQYLAQIEQEEKEKLDDSEYDRGLVSHRLKQDLLEQTGKVLKAVADTYEQPKLDDIIRFRGHQLSVTCVVISPDNQFVYSGSKDCSIIKWSLKERRKVHTIPGGRKGTEKKHIGHTAHVLCLAMSSDGKYLASGDRNNLIHLWNPDSCELLHTFKGHRGAISILVPPMTKVIWRRDLDLKSSSKHCWSGQLTLTGFHGFVDKKGLAFRKESHQLFSCSHDRSVKIWNVDERAYVETLLGHQDAITDIDSLTRERAITSGGRDASIRIWKVIEESQLVFHGHMSSIDCVALINESNFVSGADDNSLSLWTVMKKKPLFTLKNAHHREGSELSSNEENWITAVTALHNTDLIASGSKDGCIRLWKCSVDCKHLQSVFTIPVTGFVNSLKFSQDGKYLVAGIGQEHKLGRWWRLKEARNSICIIPLHCKSDIQ